MSAAPVPPQDFEFDDEFDPDIDPEHEVDFVPDDQVFDVPTDLEPIPADLGLAPADPEPMLAPEPIPVHDPLPGHDPLQQEMLCRRVMDLERIPRPPPCTCPSPFAIPPAPLLPYPDFDVRFLTMEQQISYLLRIVHALEEELAHVRNLLFVPPPPPPPPSA
ncbi:uncharacterized protein LOC118482688 [Helianthus annuus]|uniref:uncharacterized protein LOC118482688 n=1 Tax=Helianthus annuus TaxID=4232 RepID=UPI001652CD3B|nr:uncharacterized protein LOC118482688 [Helianthus annuus]